MITSLDHAPPTPAHHSPELENLMTGKARKTTDDKTDGDTYVSTKGATFAEAADAATPDDGPGYVGISPERERTGLDDKGLSLASVTSGPAPDSRRGLPEAPEADDKSDLEV